MFSKENSIGSNIENNIVIQLPLPLPLSLSDSISSNINNKNTKEKKKNVLLSNPTPKSFLSKKKKGKYEISSENEYVVRDFSEFDYENDNISELNNKKNIEMDNCNSNNIENESDNNNELVNLLKSSANKTELEKKDKKKEKKRIDENDKNDVIEGFRLSRSVPKPISSFYNSDVSLCTVS